VAQVAGLHHVPQFVLLGPRDAVDALGPFLEQRLDQGLGPGHVPGHAAGGRRGRGGRGRPGHAGGQGRPALGRGGRWHGAPGGGSCTRGRSSAARPRTGPGRPGAAHGERAGRRGSGGSVVRAVTTLSGVGGVSLTGKGGGPEEVTERWEKVKGTAWRPGTSGR